MATSHNKPLKLSRKSISFVTRRMQVRLLSVALMLLKLSRKSKDFVSPRMQVRPLLAALWII